MSMEPAVNPRPSPVRLPGWFSEEARRWQKWLLLVAIFTLMGVYSASTYQAIFRLDREQIPWLKVLLDELTATYGILLLLIPLLPIIRRLRPRRHRWIIPLALHLAASLCFGAAHTLLMTVSRRWLYPLCGFGEYWTGDPFDRLLMEYHKQLLMYLYIVLTVYGIDHLRRARRREREAAALELQAAKLRSRLAETQLQVLQGQLQPHFLFNSLNMISSIMYEDVAKADRMMSRLCSLLRLALDYSGRPLVPLRQEMEMLQLYLEIMEARFGGSLGYGLQAGEALMERPVPAFLLQPLVENAIKHGQRDSRQRLEIQVRVKELAGGSLQISVEDNGPGWPPGMDRAGGTGLRNLRERLVQLYGGREQLRMEAAGSRGARVVIEFPSPVEDEKFTGEEKSSGRRS